VLFRYQFTRFSNPLFAVSYAVVLAVIVLYCRYTFGIAQPITLEIAHCMLRSVVGLRILYTIH